MLVERCAATCCVPDVELPNANGVGETTFALPKLTASDLLELEDPNWYGAAVDVDAEDAANVNGAVVVMVAAERNLITGAAAELIINGSYPCDFAGSNEVEPNGDTFESLEVFALELVPKRFWLFWATNPKILAWVVSTGSEVPKTDLDEPNEEENEGGTGNEDIWVVEVSVVVLLNTEGWIVFEVGRILEFSIVIWLVAFDVGQKANPVGLDWAAANWNGFALNLKPSLSAELLSVFKPEPNWIGAGADSVVRVVKLNPPTVSLEFDTETVLLTCPVPNCGIVDWTENIFGISGFLELWFKDVDEGNIKKFGVLLMGELVLLKLAKTVDVTGKGCDEVKDGNGWVVNADEVGNVLKPPNFDESEGVLDEDVCVPEEMVVLLTEDANMFAPVPNGKQWFELDTTTEGFKSWFVNKLEVWMPDVNVDATGSMWGTLELLLSGIMVFWVNNVDVLGVNNEDVLGINNVDVLCVNNVDALGVNAVHVVSFDEATGFWKLPREELGNDVIAGLSIDPILLVEILVWTNDVDGVSVVEANEPKV